MSISRVPGDEVIKSCHKFILTGIVTEIVSFHVLHKDVTGDIHDPLNFSTFIDGLTHVIALSGRMSDHLPRMTSALRIPVCLVMVALNPK